MFTKEKTHTGWGLILHGEINKTFYDHSVLSILRNWFIV